MLKHFRRAVYRLAWLALLAGCGELPEAGNAHSASPAPPGSRLPHLAQNEARQPVLSWVEPRPEGGAALVYAVLGDDGWGPPMPVAEGAGWFLNWADFPSVQPLDAQLWAAHWLVKQAGGMYAYDIALALSRDGGRSWDPPLRPHQDGTASEHGFVSMWPARLEDGTTGVGLVWLDGRHTVHDPSRAAAPDPRTVLRSAVFDANGQRVSTEEVDDRVCDCCPTSIARTPAGPVVAYRNRTEDEVRDIHLAVRSASVGAAGWEQLGAVADDGWVIDGCPVNGPAVAAGASGLALAWYTEASGAGRVQVALGDASTWSPPVVVDGAATLGRVGIAALDDGGAVVSWLGEVADGSATVMLARVHRGGAGDPLRVATVDASRPTGFPQMLRDGEHLLLAWTEWHDGEPRVVTARLPLADLPAA